jgi:hypothetical protein
MRIRHIAHSRAATYYTCLNRVFGIPVVIFSTIVGTTAFARISVNDPSTTVRVLFGVLSMSAAVLAALQTFFNFAELAEKHRIFAARYGCLRREVEHEQAFPPDAAALTELMSSFEKRWNALDESAPSLPQRIFDRAQAEVERELGRLAAARALGGPAQEAKARSSELSG